MVDLDLRRLVVELLATVILAIGLSVTVATATELSADSSPWVSQSLQCTQ